MSRLMRMKFSVGSGGSYRSIAVTVRRLVCRNPSAGSSNRRKVVEPADHSGCLADLHRWRAATEYRRYTVDRTMHSGRMQLGQNIRLVLWILHGEKDWNKYKNTTRCSCLTLSVKTITGKGVRRLRPELAGSCNETKEMRGLKRALQHANGFLCSSFQSLWTIL